MPACGHPGRRWRLLPRPDLLADGFDLAALTAGDLRRRLRWADSAVLDLAALRRDLSAIAAGAGLTMSALAAGWVLAQGAQPIIGARTPAEARQIATFRPIPPPPGRRGAGSGRRRPHRSRVTSAYTAATPAPASSRAAGVTRSSGRCLAWCLPWRPEPPEAVRYLLSPFCSTRPGPVSEPAGGAALLPFEPGLVALGRSPRHHTGDYVNGDRILTPDGAGPKCHAGASFTFRRQTSPQARGLR
jgi:hypothetical protein